VNALLGGFLITCTAFLSVALGVFGAYCAIHLILAAVNPTRSPAVLPALIPEQSRAIGD
jgi:hypothetical protein